MDISNQYVSRSNNGVEIFIAAQFTGNDSPNEAFENLIGKFLTTVNNEYLEVIDNDHIVLNLKTQYLVTKGSWLVLSGFTGYLGRECLGGALRVMILPEDEFHNSFISVEEFVRKKREIQDLSNVPSALSRHAVEQPSIYKGADAVEDFLLDLIKQGRLPESSTSVLSGIAHFGIDDVSAQIMTVHRNGATFDEVLIMAGDLAPCSFYLAPGPVTAHSTFDDFTQQMKVLVGEMGEINLDHRELLGKLADTLQDANDEDQFLKIAIYAMYLHEVGEFTVGQLLEADNEDSTNNHQSDADPTVDIGEDFTKE